MSKFVSRQRNFRIFLKLEDSGGRWADFGDAGECELKNPEDAEKLRNTPGFGKDFYEVGHVEEKKEPEVLFECPDCGKTESKVGKPFDTAVKAIAHARMEHKVNYRVKDIPQVK